MELGKKNLRPKLANSLSDPDRDLVLKCQSGDGTEFEEAYRQLYALYKNRVYTICLRVTGNEEDALDAAQETMVTLARRIRDFAFRSRFSSWVYRIAVNAAIDVRRRRLEATRGSVTTVLGGLGEADVFPDTPSVDNGADPSARVSLGESQKVVQAALASINPRFSSLLVLRYVQGHSYEEISEILECNLGTVKSRLNRAHAALREFLEKRGGAALLEP